MRTNKSYAPAIKWLGIAIASEKTALSNYLKYAHLARNRGGKEMFIKLAQDEFQHMTILETERERLQAGRTWRAVKIPPSPIEQILPQAGRTGKISPDVANQNEAQILSLAMKAEKKAMDFYLAQSRKVDDAAAYNLLQRLAKMEEAHYEILQAELDNINKTGFWMGLSEISMETE
ncbi:MAG: ferritin family protein [Planctomycetota bacterium]